MAVTAGGPAREFYVVDKDILDRDEAAFVSAVVLDVLGEDAAGAWVDAYSDFDDEMPEAVKAVQVALMELGARQHRRDPGMGIELDLSNPVHARLLERFAPWSINVDLLGPDRADLGRVPRLRHVGAILRGSSASWSRSLPVSPTSKAW